MKTVIRAPMKNLGKERIMQRELQHTQFCDHVLNVLNDKHPRMRRNSNDKLSNSRKSLDGESHHSPQANTSNILTNNNLLSLNFIPDGGNRENAGTPALSRRGDHLEKRY